jgi:hypothetical protein
MVPTNLLHGIQLVEIGNPLEQLKFAIRVLFVSGGGSGDLKMKMSNLAVSEIDPTF